MSGRVKEQAKAAPMRKISPGRNKRDKTNLLKEEAGPTKERGERWREKRRDAADSKKYLWLAVGIKLELELQWTKRKQKDEGSINLYRFTVTPHTLTFVTCIICLMDRTVTLGDPGDLVFISVFRNVQNLHQLQEVWDRKLGFNQAYFKNSLILFHVSFGCIINDYDMWSISDNTSFHVTKNQVHLSPSKFAAPVTFVQES